jgi:hypothetical protein
MYFANLRDEHTARFTKNWQVVWAALPVVIQESQFMRRSHLFSELFAVDAERVNSNVSG